MVYLSFDTIFIKIQQSWFFNLQATSATSSRPPQHKIDKKLIYNIYFYISTPFIYKNIQFWKFTVQWPQPPPTTNQHSDIPWSGEEPFTLLMIFKPPNMQLFRHNLACAFNQNISFTKIIKLGLLRTEMSFGHKILISAKPYLCL